MSRPSNQNFLKFKSIFFCLGPQRILSKKFRKQRLNSLKLELRLVRIFAQMVFNSDYINKCSAQRRDLTILWGENLILKVEFTQCAENDFL
jgi:hypothetical protein